MTLRRVEKGVFDRTTLDGDRDERSEGVLVGDKIKGRRKQNLTNF